MNKDTTNSQYIHGDFDKDGTPNIDDKYPYNKQNKEKVNKEVSLSNTFRYIEEKRSQAIKVAKPIAKKEGMKYRIKGTYSVINKAVRRDPSVTNDFIGLRYSTPKKRVVVKKRWQSFNKKYKVKNKDDKYSTLKKTNNPYRAYHSNFLLGGFGTEAQFISKKFGVLNDKMHLAYKQGKSTKKFLSPAKKLIKKGY